MVRCSCLWLSLSFDICFSILLQAHDRQRGSFFKGKICFFLRDATIITCIACAKSAARLLYMVFFLEARLPSLQAIHYLVKDAFIKLKRCKVLVLIM